MLYAKWMAPLIASIVEQISNYVFVEKIDAR